MDFMEGFRLDVEAALGSEDAPAKSHFLATLLALMSRLPRTQSPAARHRRVMLSLSRIEGQAHDRGGAELVFMCREWIGRLEESHCGTLLAA